MKKLVTAVLLPMIMAACDRRVVDVDPAAASNESGLPDVYQHAIKDLQGQPVNLEQFKGKVTLMVNVASKCGFTPQYEKLQELHEIYADQGFSVIAFPCNDFGGQEPGSADEIAQTCRVQYGATFPVMEKSQVKDGPDQSPIYAQLQAATGVLPRWNFGKYLVDANGNPVTYYGSSVDPMSKQMQDAIKSQLNK